MRVAFVSHQSSAHLGGAERSMLAIIDAWRAADPELEPIVIGPAPAAALADEVRRRGWETLDVPMTGWAVWDVDGGSAQRRLRDAENAAATAAIRRLLTEREVRLVVTNTLVVPWGAIAAAALGIPHVWFVREFGERVQGFFYPGGREEALREIGELSHAVVANSFAVKAMLDEHMPPEKVSVVYPPVDLAAVRSRALDRDEAASEEPSSALRVCVLGRVTHSKGQWRVIEALGSTTHDRIDVTFVGEVLDRGADAALTRRAQAIAPTARVRFAGERENPFPTVAAADICVIPSEKEAFGRSTLECLALGRPVIATSSGAGAELIVDGESGRLVAPDDIAALARALDDYAADADLVTRHGRAAAVRAETIASGPFTLPAAISTLTAALSAQPAPLPARWQDWCRDLDDIAAPRGTRALRARARATRLVRRGLRAVRHPVRAARALRALLAR